MSVEIKVPTLPESVADATIVAWHKQPGDAISRDEVLVDVETDKVVLEVPAAESGVMGEILHPEGATVVAQQVIGRMEAGAAASAPAAATATAGSSAGDGQTSPSVRRLLDEHGVEASAVNGTGPNGRITPEDVERHVSASTSSVAASAGMAAGATAAASGAVTGSSQSAAASTPMPMDDSDRPERRVPMTRLRARIAERLLQATQTTAMLTTFNAVSYTHLTLPTKA